MTQISRVYVVSGNDIDGVRRGVNAALAQISDRLDEIEGYRGTPTFQRDISLRGNRITNVAASRDDDDAVKRTEIMIVAQQITSHREDVDPHVQYWTEPRGDARYSLVTDLAAHIDDSIDPHGSTLTQSVALVTPKVYPAADGATAFVICKADGATTVININTTGATSEDAIHCFGPFEIF